MSKLPEREWLPISIAVDRIADRCGCDRAEAKQICYAGLKDRILSLRAMRRSYYTNSSTLVYPELNEIMSRPIDWEGNRIGDYRHAEIERRRLEVWLASAEKPRAGPKVNLFKGSGGAPSKWDWEAFWLQLAVTVYDEGLPATHNDLVRKMQEWFVEHTGDHPSESEVKKRVSKLCRAIGSADN